MKKNKLFPLVHILESPSNQDFFENKKNGTALIESLKLGNIPFHHRIVTSQCYLKKALSIDFYEKTWTSKNTEFKEKKEKFENDKILLLPVIHFVAHGNSEGLGLTDLTLITWEELSRPLSKIKEKLGMLLVCTDSCQGAAGNIMGDEKEAPFDFFLGNIESGTYEDVTIAYVAFYHNLFKIIIDSEDKDDFQDLKKKIRECVKIMNNAAGLNSQFNLSPYDEMQSRLEWKEKSLKAINEWFYQT